MPVSSALELRQEKKEETQKVSKRIDECKSKISDLKFQAVQMEEEIVILEQEAEEEETHIEEEEAHKSGGLLVGTLRALRSMKPNDMRYCEVRFTPF